MTLTRTAHFCTCSSLAHDEVAMTPFSQVNTYKKEAHIYNRDWLKVKLRINPSISP